MLCTRFEQFRIYENYGYRMLCVIDPFNKNLPDDDQIPEGYTRAEFISECLGLVPTILSYREAGLSWHECARQGYMATSGGLSVSMTDDVQLSGFVLLGAEEDGYKEPDLYPLAVFEQPDTGHRALFFPYAITCFTDEKGALLYATRFD